MFANFTGDNNYFIDTITQASLVAIINPLKYIISCKIKQ